MSDERKKLMERIQKLLALAKRAGTEGEAAAAMGVAQRLMLRHAIAENEAMGFEPKAGYTEVRHGPRFNRTPFEDWEICGILQNYFNVRTYRLGGYSPTGGKFIFYLYGKEADVEVAGYVFDFLRHTYRKLFREYRTRTGCPLSRKKTFFCGITSGLTEKLRAERDKDIVELGSTAIVRIGKELEAAYRKDHPNVKSARIREGSYNPHAYDAGKAAGASISIHKGISRSPRRRRLA